MSIGGLVGGLEDSDSLLLALLVDRLGLKGCCFDTESLMSVWDRWSGVEAEAEGGDVSLEPELGLEVCMRLLWFVERSSGSAGKGCGRGDEGVGNAENEPSSVKKALELFRTLPTNWLWNAVVAVTSGSVGWCPFSGS